MSAPRTPSDIFREILQQEIEAQRKLQPDAALADPFTNPLTEKIFNVIGAAAAEPPASPSSTSGAARMPLSAFASSRAVVTAAVEDTFQLKALDPDETARTALLDASEIVVVNGERRLRLDDTMRAGVIAQARGGDLYASVLREPVPAEPAGQPSLWLRGFLKGDFPSVDAAPLKDLQAAYSARQRLRYVDGLPSNVPKIEEISRRVELAELLEPLRVLIGAEGAWDGIERRDRFVGREPEMTRLRSFVDELDSESLMEASSRFIGRNIRRFTPSKTEGLLMLYARGGLGKSTLIAKFLLDHALDQDQPFPFAYLDFDRASLDPSRPRQLLCEIVRQVSLQFPGAQADLDKLADDIRASLATTAGAPTVSASEIQDPVARFVEILQDRITLRRRAFLLVLDTLEVVQWNAAAIASLAGMIDEFRAKGLDELRVVASGRADVPELHADRPRAPQGGFAESLTSRLEQFLRDKRDIELKALEIDDASKLATSLGRATIGTAWKDDWSSAIAGTPRDNPIRREPLSIRVAVDLVARAEEKNRESLVADIRSLGIDAADDFVARLYEKRIVNHVQDALAKKLAWPGLVVRRINDDIARELLAKHCGITPDQAVDAVAALAREVWMVTRTDDGALRHRPELRSRTLPLMRRKDPARFAAIASDAVTYFSAHRQRSGDDYVEWIYHRLLIGEPPEAIVKDAGSEVLRRFSDAVDDFPPATASYITSRIAGTRLSPDELRKLVPLDALYHLTRTVPDTLTLDDRSVDGDLLTLAQAIFAQSVADSEMRNAARSLWIKTGMWTGLSDVHPADVMPGPYVRAYVFWAVRAAPRLEDSLSIIQPGLRDDRSGLRTTVQVLALARLMGHPAAEQLDRVLAARISAKKVDSRPSIQAALRLAIVFGDACRPAALNAWLTSRRRAYGDRVRADAMSLAELEALAAMDTDARETLTHMLGERRLPPRVSDEAVLRVAYHALDEVLKDMYSDKAAGERVSRMFALRSEEWVVPFGYAAARAARAPITPAVVQRLRSYVADDASVDLSGDMVAAMRIADEAGDLASFADWVAKSAPDDPAARDLRFLIDVRRTWSEAMRGLFAQHAPAEAAPESPDADSTPSSNPPDPGPVVHKDDPQKDRWGGKPEVDGRRVTAVIDSVEKRTFYFSVTVESTDGTPLQAPVIFHLHDSYARSVVRVRRVVGGKSASLAEWDTDRAFAIGVQVLNGRGQWISLELDLATLPSLPRRFLSR